MTYQEWESYDWVCERQNVQYGPGELRGLRCHNDQMEITVALANYSEETVSQENCYVVGIYFSRDTYQVNKDGVIRLPGDVCVDLKGTSSSSGLADMKEAYGETTYEYVTDFISVYQYIDESNGIVTCYGDGNTQLYDVAYQCRLPIEGTAVTPNSPLPEGLELYPNYVAPTSASQDRFDDILTIEGVNYKTGVPVVQLINNGWSLECEVTEVRPGFTVEAQLVKGDNSIEVVLMNSTLYMLTTEQCTVLSFYFEQETCPSLDVTFPGGLRFGDPYTYVDDMYAECKDQETSEFYSYEDDGRWRQSVYLAAFDGRIEIIAYSSPEGEGEEEQYFLTGYSYEHSRSSEESSAENTDYITGITIR